MNPKFDFKDITLVPETITTISSRSQVNITNEDGKLPLIVSPMDTVIDGKNCKMFRDLGYEVCLPRGAEFTLENSFISVSLDEFEKLLDWYEVEHISDGDLHVLIDIANGHMERLYNLTSKFVELRKNPNHKLIVGNVANPNTYKKFAELGVDYIRVGIGGGSGCLTSANTGVHYPMASLINECYKIKKENYFDTKIIADGGFRNYDDIIKAIALGADYVMLGGVLNKSLESASTTLLFKFLPMSKNFSIFMWECFPFMRKFFYKKFRGMSTKEVQVEWGKEKLVTSEGIVKYNKVDYTLDGWTTNFKDYLKSAMSYTNSKNLEDFRGSEFVFVTQNAIDRYYK